MIRTFPTVRQKAGGPLIVLPARSALFVVICILLLRVFFRVEMEDQVHTWSEITWSPISTRKKTRRSKIQITTKSALLAGSPIMGPPAFCLTVGKVRIMRLTPCQNGCRD